MTWLQWGEVDQLPQWYVTWHSWLFHKSAPVRHSLPRDQWAQRTKPWTKSITTLVPLFTLFYFSNSKKKDTNVDRNVFDAPKKKNVLKESHNERGTHNVDRQSQPTRSTNYNVSNPHWLLSVNKSNERHFLKN